MTNKKAENFPTRIELLFDLMADKEDEDRERYRTFFWFMEQLMKEEFVLYLI